MNDLLQKTLGLFTDRTETAGGIGPDKRGEGLIAERDCAMVASISQLVVSQMSRQAGLPLFPLLWPSAFLKVSDAISFKP